MSAVLRLVVTLVAALVVALPGTAFGRGQYFCRMLGSVTSGSCCAGAKQAPAPSVGPEVRRAGCCDRLPSAEPGTSAATRSGGAEIPFPAWAASLSPDAPASDSVAEMLAAKPEQARAPPALGPPLFLKHCALLT